MTVLEIINLLDNSRKKGRGWIASCPAHDDRNPSLSISEGEEGQVLLHCFAGCTASDIVLSLGITLSDLFTDSTNPQNLNLIKTLKEKKRRAEIADYKIQDVYREAEAVVEAAKGVNIQSLTEEELDAAMEAVCDSLEILREEGKTIE